MSVQDDDATFFPRKQITPDSSPDSSPDEPRNTSGIMERNAADLADLRSSLRSAARDRDLSESQRGNAQFALDEVNAGRNPFINESPGEVFEGGSFWGNVGRGILDTASFVGSIGTSGASAFNAGNPLATGGYGIGIEKGSDRKNQSSKFAPLNFLSGLDVPEFLGGGGEVLGVGIGDDPIDMKQFVPDDSLGGFDWRAPDVMGGFNLPDPESIVRFTIEMALDPTNFIGLGGVSTAFKLADGSIGMTNATMRAARQSKAVKRRLLMQNYELLDDAAKGSGDWIHNVLRASREGGISSAAMVRAAKRGDQGFNVAQLRSLGVQTKMTYAGVEIGGTTNVMSALGRWRGGVRTSTAVRQMEKARLKTHGKAGELTAYRVKGIPERMSRMMENMQRGSVDEYLTNEVKEFGERAYRGNLSPEQTLKDRNFELTHYSMERLLREAGNRANGSLLVEVTEAIRATVKDSDLIVKSDAMAGLGVNASKRQVNKALKASEQAALDTLLGTVVQSLKDGEGALDAVFKHVEGFAEEAGYTVADLTIDTLRPLINNAELPVSERLMVGAVVFALQKMDVAALSANQVARGVTSLTPTELIGMNGVVNRRAGTIRQLMNNVAILETIEAAATTGEGQLARGLFNATQNPKAVMEAFGHAPDGEYLMKGVVGLDGKAVMSKVDEVLDQIKGTTTPNGYALPVEFQQRLARAMDITSVTNLDVATMAASLAKTSEVGLRHLDGLEEFIKGLATGGTVKKKDGTFKTVAGQGFIEADEMYGKASVKLAKSMTTTQLEFAVRARIRNGWFNPEMGRQNRDFSMFSVQDRAFMAEAQTRKGMTGFIEGELKELRVWMTEWTSSVDQFKKYDKLFTPEGAEFAKQLDYWFHSANMDIRMYGGEAVDALNSALTGTKKIVNGRLVGSTLRSFSKDEAELLSRNVTALHVNGEREFFSASRTRLHNSSVEKLKPLRGEDSNLKQLEGTGIEDPRSTRSADPRSGFFGERNLTDAGKLAYKKEGQQLDLTERGVTGEFWAGNILEASRMLNTLGRANLGELQGTLDFFSKSNRLFKAGATASPGFSIRNMKGAIIMNYYRGGVRVTGVGGYREFSRVYDVSRRAASDEANNLLRPGGSAIWAELPSDLSPEAKAFAQRMTRSGQITAGGETGDVVDTLFELDEAQLGVNTRTARAVRAGNRLGARSEAAVTPLVRRVTTGNFNPKRKAGDGYSRGRFSTDISAGGLADSNRESVESYMRGALMWSSMRKDGYGFDAALERVASTHFDYWDFSNGGKLTEVLMPFYLFRARMTAASVEMMLATPGMGKQMNRLGALNADDDSWGDGSSGRAYTVGRGSMGGFDLFGVLDDPRAAGLEFPQALLTNLLTDRGKEGLAADAVMQNLSPLLGFAASAVSKRTFSFGRVIDDEPRQVRYEDGLVPWSAKLAGWADKKISLVTGIVKVDHPLVNLLNITSNVTVMEDGELWITDTGNSWLSNALPLLGQIENMLLTVPGYSAGMDPGKDMTEEQYRQKRERKAYNAYFSFIGIPLRLVSQDQRVGVMRSVEREVDDLLSKVGKGADAQRESAKTNGIIRGFRVAAADAEVLDSLGSPSFGD